MNKEQRINLKFLVRFEKTPTETLKLLQEVYGDDTMSRSRVLNGTRGFKKEERMLKLILRTGGHQQAKPVKITNL